MSAKPVAQRLDPQGRPAGLRGRARAAAAAKASGALAAPGAGLALLIVAGAVAGGVGAGLGSLPPRAGLAGQPGSGGIPGSALRDASGASWANLSPAGRRGMPLLSGSGRGASRGKVLLAWLPHSGSGLAGLFAPWNPSPLRPGRTPATARWNTPGVGSTGATDPSAAAPDTGAPSGAPGAGGGGGAGGGTPSTSTSSSQTSTTTTTDRSSSTTTGSTSSTSTTSTTSSQSTSSTQSTTTTSSSSTTTSSSRSGP